MAGKRPRTCRADRLHAVPCGDATPLTRLTVADRMALHGWRRHAHDRGYTRVELCEDDGVADAGDYLAIYRDAMWACWCASRHGAVVRVWRCAAGGDLGDFPSMHEALAAILAQG